MELFFQPTVVSDLLSQNSPFYYQSAVARFEKVLQIDGGLPAH
jgi:hypothetical protein